jgi:hypothetical protein
VAVSVVALPTRHRDEPSGIVNDIAILQQLRRIAHNSSVTDPNADPPKTLSAAEEKFRTFLATQNYPKTICWLMPGDVVVDGNLRYWVRKREAEATRFAALRYSEGLERNLGVMLRAICATETETFASVFVPEDDTDRQYNLMGRGLKLSCPVETHSTSTVRNPLKWRVLWWRNGQRSKELEV